MMNFEIKNENGVLTGILNGRLDSAIANQLEKDMQPTVLNSRYAMDSADKDIVLDCTGLEYISSSGLRLFLALRKEVAKKGGTLALSHINDDIRSVFTITGFFNLFEFR